MADSHLLLPDLEPAPPEMSRRDAIQLLKRTTALVRTSASSGSGFLFGRWEDEVLILTNHHVVHGQTGMELSGIEVVLDPGTGQSKVFQAKVFSSSERWNLAILAVQGVPKSRKGLSLARDLKSLYETQDLLIAGFPFGSALERHREPAPTLLTGKVASLRHDEDGFLSQIQMDADINPGNSGSPVLDPSSGEVIGVATDAILPTNISLLIPASTVRRYLDGAVSGVSARRVEGSLYVTAQVEDPFRQLRRVGLNSATSQPSDTTGPPFAEYGVSVAVEKSVHGDVTLMAPVATDTWWQVWYENGQGRMFLKPFRVGAREFLLGQPSSHAKAPRAVDTRRNQEGWLGTDRGPTELWTGRDPEPMDGGPQGSLLGPPERVHDAEVRRLELGKSVRPRDAVFGPDGSEVYVLYEGGPGTARGGVVRLAVPSYVPRARAALAEPPASGLCLSSKVILVSLAYHADEVSVLDPRSLEPIGSIEIPGLREIACSPMREEVLLRTRDSLAILSPASRWIDEQEVPEEIRMQLCSSGGRRTLVATRDGRYVFLSCDRRLARFQLLDHELRHEETSPPFWHDIRGSWLALSPDGQYIASLWPGEISDVANPHDVLRGPAKLAIFDIHDLSQPVLTLVPRGPTDVGFDGSRRWMLVVESGRGLAIFNSQGTRIRSYDHIEQSPQQLVPDPMGSAVLLRSHSKLFLVQWRD